MHHLGKSSRSLHTVLRNEHLGATGAVVLPQSRRERNLVISGSIRSRSRKCIARGKECEDTEKNGVLRMRYLLGLLVTLIDTIDRARYFPGPGSCA